MILRTIVVQPRFGDQQEMHVTRAKMHVTLAKMHVTRANMHLTNQQMHVTHAKMHVTLQKMHGALGRFCMGRVGPFYRRRGQGPAKLSLAMRLRI